ncbi:hypothetical protein BJF79_46400 [Actinomadura sp. CNU-125]|uniref:hypothetical protein n=1 Tax=Actinomadura sp. CNU-125 TaxID=1904961 RepID=UPI00096A1A50|nr:hypothetical protein [Actinomadura sp. CNU-125]OLT22174.1 hypothetical protein BJF79_46400 [Actinomadura sp. CNU-125]
MIVLVVLGLAAVAVLGAVVLLAMGRGGELSATHPDHPPLPFGAEGRPVTAAETFDLRLPRTIWGYQPEVTDEAVRRLARRALGDRDAELAALRRENAELRHRAGDPVGALYGLRETGPNAVPSDDVPPGAGDPHDGASDTVPGAASEAGATRLDGTWGDGKWGDGTWGGGDRPDDERDDEEWERP